MHKGTDSAPIYSSDLMKLVYINIWDSSGQICKISPKMFSCIYSFWGSSLDFYGKEGGKGDSKQGMFVG